MTKFVSSRKSDPLIPKPPLVLNRVFREDLGVFQTADQVNMNLAVFGN